ncbi:hypothetical protein [Streptomyces spectabilis]|uniref:HEAT repeat domain-containing protein n=1 Tax=Streptomyces spectabilis TaxID=68270 RepID=A0A5P2XFG4_STRST|nr:hypothetical protein [Streptomyces spectabilis]MBB5105667.1 hypothetical protein [Streptomyces spectabilis]MCI3906839.1 hypothetical protein [Streptomyces spectabilis]QEV63633.1 hypothetical protein CP982_37170 [Streptomyces spectabilis]
MRTHFDALPFPARTGALARYARTLAPAAYDSLRRALDAGTPDERHTALFLAVARRDLTTVADALTDPLLRRRALAAAIRLPIADEALEQLALSPVGAARHETYRVLRHGRRSALAARLLPAVHQQYGARDAALLLPACPAETVADWLPRLDPPQGVLHTLARTAPRAVAGLLAARSRGAAGHRRRFTGGHRAVASLAARRDRDAALLLLDQAPDLVSGPTARHLLRWPDRVLEILRTAPPREDGSPRELPLPPGPLPPAVRRALRALPPADLVDLARRCPPTRVGSGRSRRVEVSPDGLLALLPAPERDRLLRERTARSRAVRSIPLPTLAALSAADRGRLVGPWVARWSRRDWMVCRLAPALPLAQGEPLLRALAEGHRAHERALAWPALLACAELEGDPDEFARVAGDCERAWHDQDDVRRAALEQLSGASGQLLAALPDHVLRDAALTAVQSRDSTTGTLAAVDRLLRRAVHGAASRGSVGRAAYAVELLGHVVSDPRLTRSTRPLRIDRATAQAIWKATTPESRARADRRVHLAELLAPHLAALPDLDALVRRTALEDDDPHLAARAAAAWVAPGPLREERCAELVGIDASFATVPRVLETLVTRRTDLLSELLTAVPGGLIGRVRPRALPWAPRLRAGVRGRWLPAQRHAWETHHARVAQDPHAPLRARADAAAQLRDPSLLTALADTAPQPVAAAALGALGPAVGPLLDARHTAYGTAYGTATPRNEPVLDALLRHAATGGVRGRAAMGALRSLLKALPEQDTLMLLAPVVCAEDTPVGTRKEAARALAGLPGVAAHDALVSAWDTPRQHRDVRAVLALALVATIDRAGIAERLLRGATEPAVRDAIIHTRVGPVRDSMAPAYRAFLMRLLKEADEETAVAACRALPAWCAQDSDDVLRALIAVAVDRARSPRQWNAAARQLMWLPLGPSGLRALTNAFHELRRQGTGADRQGREDALRRLAGIADAVPQVQHATVESLSVADELATALCAVGLRREAVRLLWDICLAALRHGRCDQERWEGLLELVEERPERLAFAREPYLDVDEPRARSALLTAARLLRERGTPVSGLMALALVGAGGRATSWDDTWQAELAALRRHEDSDTATAALLLHSGRPRSC